MRSKSATGRLARTRGADFEREVVNAAKAHYLKAERTKGSGAHAKGHKDLNIETQLYGMLQGECKRRRDFKQIYGWLEGADVLFIRGDNKPALAVIPMKTYLELLQ